MSDVASQTQEIIEALPAAVQTSGGTDTSERADVVEAVKLWSVRLRRHLHRFPELGGGEENTAALVAQILERIGADVRCGVGGHGVVALLDSGAPGPTIALRADMDALPIQEGVQLPYASNYADVMHACGHDAHTAMLCGALAVLARSSKWCGRVLAVFQPAEELSPVGGAGPMIADGVFNQVSPDYIYALHIWPQLLTGEIGLKTGVITANSDRFILTFRGEGGHASRPHECDDVVTAASASVSQLQTVLRRRIDPSFPVVVSVCSLHAGTAANAIPNLAVADGTARSFGVGPRQAIQKCLHELAGGMEQLFGVDVEMIYQHGYSSVVNDAAATGRLTQAATSSGLTPIMLDKPPLIGEDVGRYFDHAPGALALLGCAVDSSNLGSLHDPLFTLDEKCLSRGISLLVDLVKQSSSEGALS